MSRGADHKGYRRLLEVFGRAARHLPDARLAFAGQGELVAELRDRATALGLADRVVFTGPIHEDHLPDVFRACDVFSLVSDRGPGRGEGIPLTPLEAASCGKPILVGNQDGSTEAADDGVEGFVLDPFDLETHAARIRMLVEDPEARRRMGEAARQRMLRHHDFKVFREHQGDYLAGLGLAPGAAVREREQRT
jgi:phosphatidylinositol alpha-1,6-mannosyltransferase